MGRGADRTRIGSHSGTHTEPRLELALTVVPEPSGCENLSHVRECVDVVMGSGGSRVSPVWSFAGWDVQFVRLGPDEQFTWDSAAAGPVYVKVITGRLAQPDRSTYAAPRVVRATLVDGDHVRAGAEGALCAVFMARNVPERVSSMDDLRIEGPDAQRFAWRTFEAKYASVTPFFDGLDAYLAPGWRLLDDDGDEIAHVFLWAAGKGVDLSTHNHGRPPGADAPAFAEVHLVLFNGTSGGGMYETPAPGAPERERYPMQRGDEHGPFFAIDEASGTPRLRDNGAVEYPWHGWEAGSDETPEQAYDLVAAFEITVPFARSR